MIADVKQRRAVDETDCVMEIDAQAFDVSPSPAERATAEAAVGGYSRWGYLKVRGVLTEEQVCEFRQSAIDLMSCTPSYRKDSILDQRVNVWRQHALLRCLTLNPRLGAIAERLAGTSLRLWHDQLLVKPAGDSRATEFHQDQPYWPHFGATAPLTAWIALVDVPAARGCMSFLPESHRCDDLPRQELDHERSLFDLAPELEWLPRVTLPLRAGDCTFHHGRTAHYAGANVTAEDRIAHAVIYTDAATRFSGARHTVTAPLGLQPGDLLEGELFPLVAEFAASAAVDVR